MQGGVVTMNLRDIQERAFRNAVNKGFYDPPQTVGERLCLVHSEVSEALEYHRDGKMEMTVRADGKPEGFPSELADIVIRVCDLASFLSIDLESAVVAKMAYNETRPHRHGGKRL
jgi:NTP pyrophosphatase (non-canonical NTP hydrolase)